MQPYYSSLGYNVDNLPNALKYYKEAVSLPIYPDLSFEMQDYVVKSLFEIVGLIIMAQISLIIQARTTSTRLPQKVLKHLPYNSITTVLEQVIRRAKKCRMVNEVIVATTTDEEDNQIVKIAEILA